MGCIARYRNPRSPLQLVNSVATALGRTARDPYVPEWIAELDSGSGRSYCNTSRAARLVNKAVSTPKIDLSGCVDDPGAHISDCDLCCTTRLFHPSGALQLVDAAVHTDPSVASDDPRIAVRRTIGIGSDPNRSCATTAWGLGPSAS